MEIGRSGDLAEILLGQWIDLGIRPKSGALAVGGASGAGGTGGGGSGG